MKKFGFVNNAAKAEYYKLPAEIVQQFGASLNQIQREKQPLLDVTQLAGYSGVVELKINGSPAHRCVYTAKFNNMVIVLHSFSKTTNGVDRKAMSTLKLRYKELMSELRNLQ